MRLDATSVDSVLAAAGVQGCETAETSLGTVCRVPAAAVADALTALAAGDLAFSVLFDLVATDVDGQVELTYALRSHARDADLFVKASVPYGGRVPSVTGSHPAAYFPEREAAEMLGVTLIGHPNPKRLLTTEELVAFPLRKSEPIRTHEEVSRRG